MIVQVAFEWREIGEATWDSGRIRFPAVDDVPGVYRFDLGDRVYIGEADRLRRRFQHYRTPGSGQLTNLRLNAAMVAILATPQPVLVAVATTAEAIIEGLAKPLDLRLKSARVLVEAAAITVERHAGTVLKNL